ncbi:PDC sensor domain-containing protein [Shewanella carassii]|uniref:Sensor histidine kinase n=1 Tax=Shewanella carassii TaxID=1987584 RepID=A0ABQ1SWR6_9GAMM|nr:cache domain-containing protein [Shewanella carassii]GGE63970.1 sensor histidine kinase [Shewanella carassii]
MQGNQAKQQSNRLPWLPSWLKRLPVKFALSQLLISALIVISTVLVLLSIQRNQLLSQQRALNQSYGQVVTARLQEVTSQIESLVSTMANLGALYRSNGTALKASIESVLELETQKEMITGGGIWPEPRAFEPGRILDSLFWYRDSYGKLQQLNSYNEQPQQRYHNEDWYKPTRFFPADRTFWSSAYRDPYTAEAMVTASVPIWQDHEFIGAATVDISLGGLNRFFRGALKDLSGYVFALDYRNHLLASPWEDELQDSTQEKPLTLDNFQRLERLFPEFQSVGEALRSADQVLIQEANQHKAFSNQQLKNLMGERDQTEAALLGTIINNSAREWPANAKLLLTQELARDPLLNEPALVSVFLMPKTYWKIVIVTPLSSLKEDATLIAGKVGIYLVAIQLLALLLLFLVQHRLFIKPISRMVAALRENNPARLELDARDREDELGMLAGSFISRTRQLETAMASLDASNLALEQQLEVQHNAQQILQLRTKQLNALMNYSQNIIYIKDLNGKYLLVNDKYCEITAHERTQLIGADDNQIFPLGLAQIYQANDQRVINNQSPFCSEEPIATPMGDILFQVTRFPVRDEFGELSAIGAIAFDLSSHKRQEQQLEQALESQADINKRNSRTLQQQQQQIAQLEGQLQQAQSKYQLLSLSSTLMKEQELQLPRLLGQVVAELSANFDQLGTRLLEEQNAESLLQSKEMILLGSTRLRHLLALVNAPQTEIKALHFDEFMAHLLALMAPPLTAANVEVKLTIAKKLQPGARAWQLLLLFYPLLSNILHHAFTQKSTPAWIAIQADRLDERHLEILVTDNGSGINQEILARIEQSASQNGAGTLSRLQNYVRLKLLGEMTISSEPEQGCQIRILLPLAFID